MFRLIALKYDYKIRIKKKKSSWKISLPLVESKKIFIFNQQSDFDNWREYQWQWITCSIYIRVIKVSLMMHTFDPAFIWNFWILKNATIFWGYLISWKLRVLVIQFFRKTYQTFKGKIIWKVKVNERVLMCSRMMKKKGITYGSVVEKILSGRNTVVVIGVDFSHWKFTSFFSPYYITYFPVYQS